MKKGITFKKQPYFYPGHVNPYKEIDDTINVWAKAHSLFIFKASKDAEIRMVECGPDKFISISPPNEKGLIVVRANDRSLTTTKEKLSEILEEALGIMGQSK